MAIQGSYKINYTDPKNGSFVIEPYTVNGTVTPSSDVLHPKATRGNTSLLLPGQYTPNYGEMVLEDLVHLLENFAGDTAPVRPTEGQLWYDTGDSYQIVDLSASGCTVTGNHSGKFGTYISDSTSLTAWYGPVSSTDNSYNSIVFKADSVMVDADNNTVITITALDGSSLTFPNTAVGGFITATTSSRLGRLKVAVKVNNALTWADVVNVNCAASAPITEHLQDGDLWYDLTVSQLKVYVDGDWVSLTAGYLPLSGGVMTGSINMGTNPILFNGIVSTSSTLTNKLYVDTAIEEAVAPLQEGTDEAIAALTVRVDGIETTLPNKVTKTGDNFSGALVFGPNGTTTPLALGIDMNNKPIVNPTITWSSLDYLDAVGETHNVVDKNYVALALKQHLDDAVHGGKAFIVEQEDGTGLITAPLFFADVSNTLTFNVNNTSYGLGVDANSLIVYTGSWLGSKISFRQFGSTDPLFEIGDSAHRSYKSLYLFDGQPQPTFGGAITDENDDTKAATKGYVLDAIATAQNDAIPVTGATFTYLVGTGPYELSLTRPGAPAITVDINHDHMSDRIQHTYDSLDGWTSGDTDLVGNALGNASNVYLNSMLNALNRYKAPTEGAIFSDAPMVGASDVVTDIDDVTHSFTLQQTAASTMEPGLDITMGWIGEEISEVTGLPEPVWKTLNFKIAGQLTVTDPGGGPDIIRFTTTPEFPTGHDLVAMPMTCMIPVMDDNTDVRAVMNNASVHALLDANLTRNGAIVKIKVDLAAGANQDYTIAGLVGADAALYDPLATLIEVKVLDSEVGSPTNGYYTNAEAAATAGVKEDGSIRIHNYMSATRSFYISITLIKL